MAAPAIAGRRNAKSLYAILFLALALRIVWAGLVPVVPLSDSVVYDLFAREIAAGRGYAFPDGSATVYWAVGASALYAMAYTLLGAGDTAVVVTNILLGCGFVAATYWLALNRFGTRTSLIAGLVTAAWPVWIQFTTVLNSELPFVFLLALSMAVQSEIRIRPVTRIVLASVLLCGAIYVRPIALPLVLALPLLGWVQHRNLKRAAIETTLSCLIVAALLTPWALRNHELFGQPVLVSANFGANLWMGNNPASTGGYMDLPPIATRNEVERDAELKTRAMTFIRENPGRYLMLCLRRIALTFDRESIGVSWNAQGLSAPARLPLKIISAAYWYAVLGLALAGLALWLRKGLIGVFDPLFAATGLFTAIGVMVVGMDRYHMPLAPFMAIYAAIAINRFWAHFRPETHDLAAQNRGAANISE